LDEALKRELPEDQAHLQESESKKEGQAELGDGQRGQGSGGSREQASTEEHVSGPEAGVQPGEGKSAEHGAESHCPHQLALLFAAVIHVELKNKVYNI